MNKIRMNKRELVLYVAAFNFFLCLSGLLYNIWLMFLASTLFNTVVIMKLAAMMTAIEAKIQKLKT